jgi:hypothetical protein
VLLRRIQAAGFLSFGDVAEVVLDPSLTVVTGPNGVGKSNLGRCLELCRAVIGRTTADPVADRLDLYKDAGFQGSGQFEVRADVDLDQGWERTLVRAFVCSAFATTHELRSQPNAPSAAELDVLAREGISEESLAPMWSGSLIVRFDSRMQLPWFAAWEFAHAGQTWHITLAWHGGQQLRSGHADPSAPPGGARSFATWLLEAKLDDKKLLDFAAALQVPADQALTFWVSPLTAGNTIPQSLRDLASALGYGSEEVMNRNFGFDQVLSTILRRGIVLTDNRRLPLARRFSLEELGRPTDLRDGSGVAAELYRLKNGDARENERFEQIGQTFTYLTRRTLGLRARPGPADGQGQGMIIEPTVIDGYGERPVEFAGAGVQEALVLSALLPSEPGRTVVLDEPAVNLVSCV